MKIYRSKYTTLPGSSYDEVARLARKEFQHIKRLTKRQPYVRSVYFSKDKVFLSLFWEHLAQKHRREKVARLKFYVCALDLLRHSPHVPDTIVEANNPNILLHRFTGRSKDGLSFCVQIKHNKRTGRKDFMSVFAKSHVK